MSYIWQIIFTLFSAFQFPAQECYPQNWLIWPVTDSLEATNWVNNRHPNTRCFLEPLLTQSFQSVQFSRSVMSNSLQPHGLQHPRLPYLSPTRRACSNSSPVSRWYHATISSSVIPFSSSLPLLLHALERYSGNEWRNREKQEGRKTFVHILMWILSCMNVIKNK